MKHIGLSFEKLFLVAVLAISSAFSADAQTADGAQDSILQSQLHHMDSVEISLLTVGPGNEVWSLYGHTAIRYNDRAVGQDLAVNYGMFSFGKSFFIARFVLGLTDYEMGITTMESFLRMYEREGRWVYQQVLNLTPEEKLLITQALEENSLPDNRVYRYNYFYNNCTTKARDVLMQSTNLDGYLPDNERVAPTYRSMVYDWVKDYPWTRFGNDLLLGLGADRSTSYQAREFLPDNLRKDFDNTIIRKDGQPARKLVANGSYLIPPAASIPSSTPITPRLVLLSFLILTAILSVWAMWKKHSLWVFDMLLLLVTGLAGVILFIMIFSEHPTVRLNLQILLLNPLSLFFLIPVIRNERKGRGHWYWKVLTICLILFLIGGFFQTYAEGMYFLALALLLRCLQKINLAALYKSPCDTI